MSIEKLSCGVVLARREEERWLTLMLRAYHHWDFPKGLRELGEEPIDAATAWLQANPGVLDGWLDQVTTIDGNDGLLAVKEHLEG